MKVSPFAPQNVAPLPMIAGVKLAACEAGIRYKGRTDLTLAVMEEGTVVAGALTRSKTSSAAVDWCRAQLSHGSARCLVVNSGNANAFTGMKGREAVQKTAEQAAAAAGCTSQEVMIASTGVIGEPLDTGKFAHLLGGLAAEADAGNWSLAARAIMTTDTYPKMATRTVGIDGVDVRINGIAKGSGMIAPDMATMLSFLFTDLPISRAALQAAVDACVPGSFNSVSVDSDTSTSDTLLVFATGAAKARGLAPLETIDDPRYEMFKAALFDVMRDLALQVVKDGEGISKFLQIEVTGAENDAAAKVIARSIADSPLVKTAMAGEDPNWGRIVMAVGKAGEAADRDRLGIWFGDIEVARDGEVAPDYKEEDGAAYMKRSEIEVRVDLHLGQGRAMVWGCDLTHAYIDINADYRS